MSHSLRSIHMVAAIDSINTQFQSSSLLMIRTKIKLYVNNPKKKKFKFKIDFSHPFTNLCLPNKPNRNIVVGFFLPQMNRNQLLIRFTCSIRIGETKI